MKSDDADRPYQPTAAALNELLSFEATPEEERILEDFESFRKENPFRLTNLKEDQGSTLLDPASD